MSEFALNRLTIALRLDSSEAFRLNGSVIGISRAICGMARVIHDDSSLDALREGDILIASAYNPAWRPRLSMLRGVIVASQDSAAQLAQASHELDLPVVSSVTNLMGTLRTGMIITCDAKGEITQLDERRRPGSPMRMATPAARTSRLRLAEGPGHFAAAVSWSVVNGGVSGDEERSGEQQ